MNDSSLYKVRYIQFFGHKVRAIVDSVAVFPTLLCCIDVAYCIYIWPSGSSHQIQFVYHGHLATIRLEAVSAVARFMATLIRMARIFQLCTSSATWLALMRPRPVKQEIGAVQRSSILKYRHSCRCPKEGFGHWGLLISISEVRAT
ncbi:hypothetical protein [Mesorhizobium japonicum]|uniref:hypothetical protein n=1 Tax=Mesorhizobium japonicum TaxID=2066070 RepID=UPI0012FE8978|nr:hypothetical protein [Mesorhizobium japonicum]